MVLRPVVVTGWCRDIIYTYTGPILIAVNPFKRLPLYTDHSLDAYRQVKGRPAHRPTLPATTTTAGYGCPATP